MPVQATCAKCAQKVMVPDAMAGGIFTCSTCKRMAAPPSRPTAPPASQMKPAPAPLPPPQPSGQVATPAVAQQQSPPEPQTFRQLRLKVGLIITGVMLVMFSVVCMGAVGLWFVKKASSPSRVLKN